MRIRSTVNILGLLTKNRTRIIRHKSTAQHTTSWEPIRQSFKLDTPKNERKKISHQFLQLTDSAILKSHILPTFLHDLKKDYQELEANYEILKNFFTNLYEFETHGISQIHIRRRQFNAFRSHEELSKIVCTDDGIYNLRHRAFNRLKAFQPDYFSQLVEEYKNNSDETLLFILHKEIKIFQHPTDYNP